MSVPKSLKQQLRELIAETPNGNIFPPEPWDLPELQECARIVEDFVSASGDVIQDENPWADWLDRWSLTQKQ